MKGVWIPDNAARRLTSGILRSRSAASQAPMQPAQNPSRPQVAITDLPVNQAVI